MKSGKIVTDYQTIVSICFIIILSVCITDLYAQQNTITGQSEAIDFPELPQTKWKFETGASIFSSPVVNDNVVFSGSNDSSFYAIDIHSGKVIWKFRTNGEIRSTALLDGERIYLNGGDGILYALNQRNGSVIWKFRTGGEKKYDFADYFHSSPVTDNKIIYFGSGDSFFYAVNSETGLLAWKFKTGNIIHSAPAISNNKIFFGSFDGYVYALDKKTGKLAWKFKSVGHRYFPKGEVQGSPAVFNGLVIIGARDYNIYALDQEKGYCHWNKSFTRGWGLNNVVYDSVLYTGSADERVLISSEPESGSEYWKKNMEFLVFGNPVFSKNMLYIGTTIGKLHGINIHSGEKVWSYETESYNLNRNKYFKPDDTYRDDIYSIITSNEQFLEVECELGGVFSSPYIGNDIIIFTSTNGTIYCLTR
ncbi:MAG: PQQ-binding-like beta-propeller repeat protein [Bacteroidia bacterium]|nr:PQQ-binding-like beta-propeller repeat protein [Bacteroidia bacterium]